jgi:hypothetical protein
VCAPTIPGQNCGVWQCHLSKNSKTKRLLFIYLVFNTPKAAIIPLIIYHVNVNFVLIGFVLTDIADDMLSTIRNAMGSDAVFTNVAGVYCVDGENGSLGSG